MRSCIFFACFGHDGGLYVRKCFVSRFSGANAAGRFDFHGRGGFFLDLAETDTYGQRGRRNGKTVFDDTTRGGVFLDHKQAPDEAVGIAFFWEEAKIKHGYWKENLE